MMNEFKPEVENNDDEIQIDLSRLLAELRKKTKFIVLVTLICIVVSFIVTNFMLDKKYDSKANIYLKPNITESGTIDAAALTANSKMVNNYVLMLKGDTLLTDVSKKLNIKDADLVKNAISVDHVSDSEIISVTARTEDPQLSKDIVETTVNLFFETMKDKLDIKNMTVLDQPKVEKDAVFPSLPKNLVLGTLLGIIISCGIVVVEFLLDKRLHSKDDAESYLGIPVLAEIPWTEDL